MIPVLADSQCAQAAAGCKTELAVGINVLAWIMAGTITVLAGWKLMFPVLSGADTPDHEIAERRGLLSWIMRKMVPLLLLVLLEGFILAILQNRLAGL